VLYSVERFFLMTYRVIITIASIHIPKKVMAVFERRYLKRNSTESRSGHRGGVYTVEALGVSF
jgi:hypothetical protein